MQIRPIIFGISGTKLTVQEIIFFRDNPCLGFILFARNLKSKNQIIELNNSLRALYPDQKILILVDQEGGRVARLRPPIADKLYPKAEKFAELYTSNKLHAMDELENNYYDLCNNIKELGFDSPCAPVADLRYNEASEIISCRSFGSKVGQVIDLCESAILGINKAGALPIIKHIPGHGRSSVDSHIDLPIVKDNLDILETNDFQVFKSLAQINRSKNLWAMTAHIIFTALDPDYPVTLSKKAIDYIRDRIGFKGIIVTDDMCMYALHGEVGQEHYKLTKLINVIRKNPESWRQEYVELVMDLLKIDVKDYQDSAILDLAVNGLTKIKPEFIANLVKTSKMALEAGCDVILHCSGEMDEMKEIAKIL